MKTWQRALGYAASLVLIAGVCCAGLYSDDEKNAAKGELNDQDYWWTKFDLMMMDLAIKQDQPDGRIGLELAKHEEIQNWKKQIDEVQSRIDSNADRGKPFGPECPWEESNFSQLWVNLHWAHVAFEAKDYTTALSCLQNVMQNYDIMLKPDRMKDYPEDLRKWVVDSKPDAEKLYKAVKEKTGR